MTSFSARQTKATALAASGRDFGAEWDVCALTEFTPNFGSAYRAPGRAAQNMAEHGLMNGETPGRAGSTAAQRWGQATVVHAARRASSWPQTAR